MSQPESTSKHRGRDPDSGSSPVSPIAGSAADAGTSGGGPAERANREGDYADLDLLADALSLPSEARERYLHELMADRAAADDHLAAARCRRDLADLSARRAAEHRTESEAAWPTANA